MQIYLALTRTDIELLQTAVVRCKAYMGEVEARPWEALQHMLDRALEDSKEKDPGEWQRRSGGNDWGTPTLLSRGASLCPGLGRANMVSWRGNEVDDHD